MSISGHRRYCSYVRNVTFQPPPFDFDATNWTRYHAFARADSKLLDKRHIGDFFSDDAIDNEPGIARLKAAYNEYVCLYREQKEILSNGSYMACCVSALAKFNRLDEARILGYTSDKTEMLKLYERVANHIRQSYPEVLVGFVAPLSVRVAEEHIANSLKAAAIAGMPLNHLAISGMVRDKGSTSHTAGLNELCRLPFPIREKLFSDLMHLEIELASDDFPGSSGTATEDWSHALSVLLESAGPAMIDIRYLEGLSRHDPGGYWSFHRMFTHGDFPGICCLDLEGTKICARDFCAFLGRHETLDCIRLQNILLTGAGSGLWREVYHAIHDLKELTVVMIIRPLKGRNSSLCVISEDIDMSYKHNKVEAKLLDYLFRRGPWDEQAFEALCN